MIIQLIVDDDIKKAQSSFIKRLIAAVIVFFVPTITGLLFDVLETDPANTTESDCFICILNPERCEQN